MVVRAGLDVDEEADSLLRRAARLQSAAAKLRRMSGDDASDLLDDVAEDDARALLERYDSEDAVDLVERVATDQWRTRVVEDLIDVGRKCARRLYALHSENYGCGVEKGSFEARMESESATWQAAFDDCFDDDGNYIDGKGLNVEMLKEFAGDVEQCASMLGDDDVQSTVDEAREMLDELEEDDLDDDGYLEMRR